jgi:voltage-gated potassium channel
MSFRKRLYLILTPTEKGGWLERMFEVILIVIIILNILAIVLDSVHEIHDEYHEEFLLFEIFSVIFFTVEYILRLYSIVENPKFKHPVKGRLAFVKSPIAIVDLLAFAPFYLTFLPIDLRFLRMFRLMGLFRMFKIARYLEALNLVKKVLTERKEQLVLSIVFILFVLVIISTIMFYVEREAQPDAFSSIPATMWWGVATLTTVGYGDIVPITPLGKIMGGMFTIMGVGLLALPAGILSSGFFEQMFANRVRKKTCPHCGKDFHE